MNKKLLIPLWIWKTMRMSLHQLVLLAALCGASYARETSGQTVLEKRVTLDVQGTRFKKVLSMLEEQADVRFLYSPNSVDTQRKVKLKVTDQRLDLVLRDLLLPHLIEFSVSDGKMISLKKVQPPGISSIEVPEITAPTMERKVSGRVSDENGDPLPGVSILVKGTQKGLITDLNGDFSIEIDGDQDILTFSFVGYITQEVVIGNRTALNIQLNVDEKVLEELVVVGYGNQKRANVIGSVATISGSSLENRSTSNVSSSLAGLAAGVNVQASTGRPGADGSSILIRGTGTLNNTSPLVVIDGIVGNMNSINPNDIESISILKDAATAAIYGSLGSNGVILITTKKGTSGKVTVSYNGITSMVRPNNMPEFVTDYGRHMRLVNEGFTNLGQAAIYTQPTIDQWEEAARNPGGITTHGYPNRVAYPNTNWGKVLFGERRLLQNHNITLNGGSENTQYLFSLGYFNNPGTMPMTGADNLRMRINLQSKVAKFLTVGTQTFGDLQNTGIADVATAYSYLTQTVPGVYPEYEGKFGFPAAAEESATANNAIAYLYSQGGRNQVTRLNSTVFAKLDLFKGLQFESKVHYNNSFTENNTYPVPYEKWNFATNQLSTAALAPGQMRTQYSLYKSYNVVIDNVLRYNGSFGSHDVGGILGYNQQYANQYNFAASKIGLVHPDITTLNSGITMTGINGDETDYALRSVFGRGNYAYKQRYLGEVVIRYDGSSRFGEARRWGLFPAFSLGWRISDEAFLDGLKPYVDDLRIRASWGRTGTNSAGNYDHLPSYGSVPYSFNNQPVRGLAQTKLGNSHLHWERTTTANIGLTGTILRGQLSFDIDYYRGYTDGILFVPNIPATTGTAAAATMNIAEVSKRGLELSLTHNNKVNDLRYSISGNFAYNMNRVEKYKGRLNEGYVDDGTGNMVFQSNIGQVSNGGTQRILEDHMINEFYLYNVYRGSGSYTKSDGSVDKDGGPRDGMIRTPEDMRWLERMVESGYIFQPADGIDPTKIWYGDLIYADLNGDGIYGNVYDQQFTGERSTPAFNFGLNTNISYKGFDMSMIWSASTGMSYYYNVLYLNQSIVAQGKSIPLLVADNHYYYNASNPADPANNINGYYPRLKGVTDAQNGRASDYYFYNASYAKLRNLQLGYTLPSDLTKRFSVSRLRIYLAGENLLTITKFPGLDPEIGPNPNYPTMRQYSLGLNVTF